MRVYRLRLFGFEVGSWSVEGEPFDPVAAMREAIEQLADDTPEHTQDPTPNNTEDNTDTGSETGSIGGASIHNFERDANPRYPELDKDCDSWMPRPFGFHRGPS